MRNRNVAAVLGLAKRSAVFPLALIALVALGATARAAGEAGKAPVAPDFELIELMAGDQSDVLRLLDLKGRPVILYFWTTYCPYCAQDLPALLKAFPGLGAGEEDAPVFLAVDIGESEQAVRRHIATMGYGMRVLLDAESEVAFMYRAVGTPTYVFITPDGRIAARHLGPMEHEAFRKHLAAIRTG